MKNTRIIWQVLKRTGAIKLVGGYVVIFFGISALIALFEPDVVTYRDGLWYCYSVATTVGFGDMVAVTAVGKILSVILSIYSILLIAIIPGVLTSYYVEAIKLRANESSEKFLYDLERLPELSKEELAELSEKVKKFNKRK